MDTGSAKYALHSIECQEVLTWQAPSILWNMSFVSAAVLSVFIRWGSALNFHPCFASTQTCNEAPPCLFTYEFLMDATINPLLLQSDRIVLQNLLRDIGSSVDSKIQPTIQLDPTHDDVSSTQALAKLRNEPSVFTNWDWKDLPSGKGIGAEILHAYIGWAQGIVRNPVDVVFLTHIGLYLGTSVPSALFLYYRFSWVHGILHWLMQLSYCGSFTLMLHNHIHNNGLLRKQYAWFDLTWPYILEPLMGHTWDSYYYHHVKHHHVESNGPDDLSSTIRYQRDELWDFCLYVGRFVAFIWIELPLYFVKKRKIAIAAKVACNELFSYLFIYLLARAKFYPTLFVLIIPLIQMRIGLMVGNFGQHALVDDIEPSSDFRSSITLIDVPVRNFSRGAWAR